MRENLTRKGLAAIYRQEIIRDVTLFTSQSAAVFYDKLFTALNFTLPRAATGRRGFPKEAMVCAFIVMKCEGFSQITDLADYLDNNRLIARYCGFDIMRPLPSYWTYDHFLKKLDNGELKSIMAQQVKKLYEPGIVDASFIGLDSTAIAANTKQNNSKCFASDKNLYSQPKMPDGREIFPPDEANFRRHTLCISRKFNEVWREKIRPDGILSVVNTGSKFELENHPKADRDCALSVHSASNQHDERRYEFYWGHKNHVLVDCISGLPLYELTTPANVADASVAPDILFSADAVLPLRECTFLGDKGYDVKAVYDLVKDICQGDAVIPLNKRNTKNPENSLLVILSTMLSLPCTRTERLLMAMEACARSFAVLSANPKPVAAPVTTKIGTTARKTEAVPNTNPSLIPTDFPLTGNAPVSSGLMHYAPNVSVTTPALRLPARNVSGFVMQTAPPI